MREGSAAAQLNHPGIVTIYAADVYDGRPAIVMELIEGQTLRRRARAGRADSRGQPSRIIDQLLDAVAYAHERGVVHRDIKPDNVFVTHDGRGQARRLRHRAGRRRRARRSRCPGTMLGTPAYMAPEQIRGEPVDVRCDVFALGVIAYECLTGENPFGSGTATHYATIVHRIINEPAPR